MMLKPPNILWICSDQQRWDTLGCYGNSFVNTPNLDRLAAAGALFENAFCQSPVCTPSRASFLTGRYPVTTRCRQNGQDIPSSEVLVTRLFADAGYECGLAGKLHLSACHPSVCPTMERRIDDGYRSFHWSHHSAGGWGVNNEYHRWLQAKNLAFDQLSQPHPDCEYITLGPPEEHHQTTWCVEKAVDFIRENQNSNAPWLFSINLFDPHHAFDAPEGYLARYLDALDEIPLPSFREGELENKSRYQRTDHLGAYGNKCGYPYPQMSDRDHRYVRASYWAMCDLIDHQVGRLVDHLKQMGQFDNTIIVYTSDHGEMLGDHGIYLKGPYFYEPAIHVPLIIHHPATIQAGRHQALVELVDLAPTLLQLCELERHPGMQGQSFHALLEGTDCLYQAREDVYCEYYNAMPWHHMPHAHLSMVRTQRHKLVADHSDNSGELYDLIEDPGEHRNLWDDVEHNSLKMAMLQRLCRRMAWTVDPLPERKADW